MNMLNGNISLPSEESQEANADDLLYKKQLI